MSRRFGARAPHCWAAPRARPCLCKSKLPAQPHVNTRRPIERQGHLASCWPKGGEHHEFSCAMSGRARLTLRDTGAGSPKQLGMSSGYGDGVDTEAGMLSGISRKRSIRSNPYWFTEFCNSQCLSHFAAPFIVVRAETSIAESCIRKRRWLTPPRATCRYMCIATNNDSFTAKEDGPRLLHYPRLQARGSKTKLPTPYKNS